MKTRQAHATLPHVPEFIGWLATELDSRTLFKHQYVDRRSGAKWSCESLYDAYRGYAWNHPGNARLSFNPGASADSNAHALEALRQDLQAAGSDDERVLQGALDVMAWGGVSAHNAQWLKANKVGLGRMVQDVKAALIKKDPDAPILRSNTLRFNSGMTKIYSLVCPEFVIYDSRVAAGLGRLVVQYCKAKGLTRVPEGLNFPWAAAKEGENSTDPKNRNPSTGTLQFKRLRSGSHHARWNMNASWVLSQVASHARCAASPFRTGVTPAQTLRAIEQALFMIGYDLGAAANA
ncbi:hypothetical protein M2D63_001175 [Pseudomonas sp. BJa5]|uniref:hypothetical protein n=1 Tax=Pseudomonas sp. BJa5 TaxID=2936270 RepID=UPI00255A20F8|nr:hypothetical protein [Pseudomonas sp. BGr12]MDL2419727.1 hypothetical protein [Pseudomonas sp. BGr12]